MPLLMNVLVEEILRLTDKTRGDFKGFPMVLTPVNTIDLPATNDVVATNWATAAGIFFAGISVPPGAVLAVPAGVAAFKATFLGLLLVPGGGIAALEQSFVAMAAILAASSPPVATPPIGPPLIVAAMAPFIVGAPNPLGPALATANAVFTWTKTGLWGPPPAPPSSPWA